MGVQSILSLVDKIYECVLNPDRWENLADELRREFDAACGVVYVIDYGRNDEPGFIGTVGMEESWQRAYREHYSDIDPWNMIFETGNLHTGDLLASHHWVSDRDLRKTEYYNDFWGAMGWHHTVGCKLAERDQVVAQLGLPRGKGQSAYNDEELALVQHLYPHLKRAVELSHRLEIAKASALQKTILLDRLPFGVILLRSDRSMLEANAVAEEVIAESELLCWRRGSLHLLSREQDRLLQTLVSRATSLALEDDEAAAGGINIDLHDGARLSIVVAPSRTCEHMMFGRQVSPAAVIFLIPSTIRSMPGEILKGLFALTPAETRLALELSQGPTLDQACDRLGIGKETARSQLKRLFEKTGTDRQATLVQLLTRLSHSVRI